ncbi:olfactory receptor 5AP2-like [Mantella aurantiaca]
MELPSFALDTMEVLQKLEGVTVPSGTLLAGLDVESLFTCIPHVKGIQAISCWLERRHPLYPVENEFLVELLELALHNNFFMFKGKYYRQNRGVAMGTACAPVYECLYLGWWEETEVYTSAYFHSSVNLWIRYMDDVLVAWQGSLDEFDPQIKDIVGHTPRLVARRVNYLKDHLVRSEYNPSMPSVDTFLPPVQAGMDENCSQANVVYYKKALYFHEQILNVRRVSFLKRKNSLVMGNYTQVTIFVLSGLTDNDKLIPFLFSFFLIVYLVTVLGNIGLITIVHVASNLNTPMYNFLSYLSAVDLFYSTSITPKTLSDLTSPSKTILFKECAIQMFVFAAMAGTEVLLLSSMSYDRYAAICHPLHYISIMTKKKCVSLVSLSFFFGFFQSIVQTSCLFSLWYCGPNHIDHFYCDISPILKLSCSKTLHCNILTMLLIGSYSICSLSGILVSYILIFSAILRIQSSEGRKKAFNTCSSHLVCASVFYVAVLFTYLRSPSSFLEMRNNVASVFYAVVTPMLNPLIYSLRNQEVKKAIKKAITNISYLVKNRKNA